MGRHEEALQKFKLAQDRDPLTVLLKISAGRAYLDARQYDQAIKQFRGVIELDPKQFAAHGGLCTAYTLKGMYEEGIAECQRARDLPGEREADLAWAYATAGKRNHALTILSNLNDRRKHKYVSPLSMAALYSALEQKHHALTQLERAYEKHDDILLWLKVDPRLDNLRSEARFTALLRRIGFPD
jgi:serine/threonine-protein kinase